MRNVRNQAVPLHVSYGCPHLPSCDGLRTLACDDVLRPDCAFSMACEEADELDRSLLSVDASCVCRHQGEDGACRVLLSVIVRPVGAYAPSHRERTTSGVVVTEPCGCGAGDSITAACCPRSMWKLARRATLAALSPGNAGTQTTVRGCWLPSTGIWGGVVVLAAASRSDEVGAIIAKARFR